MVIRRAHHRVSCKEHNYSDTEGFLRNSLFDDWKLMELLALRKVLGHDWIAYNLVNV